MVNNVLIFRTDRIGDLLVTCPTIITIKRYLKNHKITLITSKKNYRYARSLNLFNEIYEFPDKGLIQKVKFIYQLKKEKPEYVFVFDGKDRSIISAALINAKYKIAISTKNNLFYKLFKIKFFTSDEGTNLNDVLQKSLNYCHINSKINNYDFLSKKKDNNFSAYVPVAKWLHIHLDEKWFSHLYIKKYTNIHPTYDGFIDFLNKIPIQHHILITTGTIDFELLDELKNKYFEKVNQKIFLRTASNRLIYLIYKPTFDDLESLLRNSKILISCHGAITHAANSFDVKIVDIIERSREKFYKKFTLYLKNYSPTFRCDFNLIKTKLLKIIKN